MPDDQNKPFDPAQGKSSTIDDLVKELSRSQGEARSEGAAKSNSPSSPRPPLPLASAGGSTESAFGQTKSASQGPPSNLPGVKVENKPPVSPLSAMPPRPAVPPKPLPTQSPLSGVAESRTFDPSAKSVPDLGRVGTKPPTFPPPPSAFPPKPQPAPPLPTPPSPQRTAPVPSESKILDKVGTTSGAGRPAQEYRSSIRTMSEDIANIKSGQKPLGTDVPRRVTPDTPKAPLPGTLPQQAPAPSGPTSSVGLGRTEKTGPLPGLPGPATVPSSKLGPTVGLGQAGKTGPLPSPTPQKPAELFKVPGIQPSVIVPSEKKGPNTTFYLLIAGVLAVGGFLYWFLVLRVAEPEVVLSPTPTPTVTPTPIVRSLSEIFSGTPINFEVTLSESVSGDFKTFVNTLSVAGGDFLKINLVQDVEGSLIPLNWLDMFVTTLTLGTFGLKDNIVILDSTTLVYGQSEMFNEDGTIDFDTQDLKKTAFVARVSDAAGVATAMADWELTIAEDLGDYLLVADTSKKESVNFLDNTYRGASIRYKNFPFPDTTVDYAVVSAASQNYLIIAGSREAMYAAIDVLLEQ